MSEVLAGNAGLVQTAPEIEHPSLEQSYATHILHRLHNKWAALVTAGATVAAIGGLGLEIQTAHASPDSQVTIGMPFEGEWGYNTLTTAPCGRGSGQTAHPSCHETYFGDWATDLYAPPGTEVKLRANGAGTMSFAWDAASGTCGETRRVRVFSNGFYVGRVHFAHLSSAAPIGNPPTNGMTIGRVANLSCNPGGSDKHVHVEFDNASTSTHSCYINHSNGNSSAGIRLGEGTGIGVLGSPTTSATQPCTSSLTPGGGTPPSFPTTILDFSDAVWAKEGTGWGGWTQETNHESAKTIATGGDTQILLDHCGAVWARGGIGAGGWTQEAGCGSAQEIAVSDTGLQMLRDYCGAIWAKNTIDWGGWTQETSCDGHKSIATAGATQVIINACGAIWAKEGVGWGQWVQETDCGAAKTVAVGSTGIQAVIDHCGAIWAKRGIGWGGWTQETGCDGHKAITVGGDHQMILNACNAVWAKPGVGWGGWIQETDCGAAKAIAAGSSGRHILISNDDAVWAKDTLGWGGWNQLTASGSAKVIDAG